jgi:predicted transcriptional regulator
MSTGKVIREIRREQKMPIGRLAELSGLHRNTVSRVEMGEGISLDNFEKILNALGYELEIMEKQNAVIQTVPSAAGVPTLAIAGPTHKADQ